MRCQAFEVGKATSHPLALDSFSYLNTMSPNQYTLVKQTQRNVIFSMGMKKTAILLFVVLSSSLMSACSLLEASATQTAVSMENQAEKIAKTLEGPILSFPVNPQNRQDPTLDLYRDQRSRSSVVSFYTSLTGSAFIARTILEEAEKEDVSPSLAFSVAWVESGYHAKTVSHNSRSVDRGLFQLNSKTFTSLEEEDFFDPKVNASHGLRYLDYCLSYGNDEIVALALYNAGLPRIQNGAVPRSTYGYIAKVLSYKADLDKRFGDEVVSRWLPRSDY
jgi:hypothetical protein